MLLDNFHSTFGPLKKTRRKIVHYRLFLLVCIEYMRCRLLRSWASNSQFVCQSVSVMR